MPFKFRLNSVLKHREFLLRQAQGAFGAATAARLKIEAELEELKGQILAESIEFEDKQRRGIGVDNYRYFKERLAILEQELRLCFDKLRKASELEQIRRQVMIECDKSVKTLENIETKDRQMHKLALSREEQKKLDYAAGMLAYRKTTDEGEKP
ncbi:MAG: flagellar FliJ family protein [Syntrophobacteraceae bacterium]